MTSKLIIILLACATICVSGLRRSSRSVPDKFEDADSADLADSTDFAAEASLMAQGGVDCSVFEGLKITKEIPPGGKPKGWKKTSDVGDSLVSVCENWPSWLGDFPVNTAQKAVDLLQAATTANGLWNNFTALKKKREGKSDFCWIATSERNATMPHPDCYVRYKKTHPETMAGTSRTKEPTDVWCQKRCALTEGCAHFTYWWDGGCHLQDEHATQTFDLLAKTGPPECPSQMASGQPLGACDAVYNGECYGACPYGFQPSRLAKWFAPVCVSDCSEDPDHPVGCGLGCASSGRTCLSTIEEQVESVANGVAQAISFATGTIGVYKIVHQVLGLAHFIVEQLWEMIQTAKQIWKAYPNSGMVAGFVTIFLAWAVESAKEYGQSAETLIALFNNVMAFWMKLVQKGISFQTAPVDFVIEMLQDIAKEVKVATKKINSNKPAKALQQPDARSQVDSAWGIVRAFVYPKCKAPDAVAR